MTYGMVYVYPFDMGHKLMIQNLPAKGKLRQKTIDPRRGALQDCRRDRAGRVLHLRALPGRKRATVLSVKSGQFNLRAGFPAHPLFCLVASVQIDSYCNLKFRLLTGAVRIMRDYIRGAIRPSRSE
jgi:hypothetical protein